MHICHDMGSIKRCFRPSDHDKKREFHLG